MITIDVRAGDTERRHVLVRAMLTSTALIVLIFPTAVVLGAYMPALPLVGRFGTFMTTNLATLVLAVAAASGLAFLAIVIGGGRVTKLLIGLCIAVLGGYVVAGTQLSLLAAEHGATISIPRQLTTTTPPAADRRVVYASVGGQDLHADLWFPPLSAPPSPRGGRSALVFVHGGAFVGGGLGTRKGLFASLALAGHVVVDVEYRLAPPPRWDDAPADVLCSLAWIAGEAPDLGVNPAAVVLMGESAGASLALVAGYAAGTDAAQPSCAGTPLIPAGVIAISPAADLEGIWSDRTLWYGNKPFPEAYVGGPPSAFPERYAAAAPFDLLRKGLPPTLVVGAANDQLVLPNRVTSLAERLAEGGVDTTLVMVPFADHGFDGPSTGFGAQLLETVVPSFILRTSLLAH